MTLADEVLARLGGADEMVLAIVAAALDRGLDEMRRLSLRNHAIVALDQEISRRHPDLRPYARARIIALAGDRMLGTGFLPGGAPSILDRLSAGELEWLSDRLGLVIKVAHWPAERQIRRMIEPRKS